MPISIKLIQELRKITGAGISDCQQALEEAGGVLDRAREILRKKGKEVVRKKQSREAREGTIGAYLYTNGKLGCMIKVYCETDFVARNKEFQNLAHDLAMQVLAADASYISQEDIPKKEIEKQKKIILAEIRKEKKPKEVQDKIVAGKLEKYWAEVCLLTQPFFKKPEITIQDLVAEKVVKLGEKIVVGEFVKFEL